MQVWWKFGDTPITTTSCLEAFIYYKEFQFVEPRLYFSPHSWFRMSDCLIEAVVEAVSLSGVSNVLSESVQPTSWIPHQQPEDYTNVKM